MRHGAVENAAPRTREVIREWDRRAIEEYGIPGVVLMENAGAGAAGLVLSELEAGRVEPPFRILCGPGNNGGDGLVVARWLKNAGVPVEVVFPVAPAYESGSDSGIQCGIAQRMGIPMAVSATPQVAGGGTWIDALFGTGLSRALGSPYRDWVECVVESEERVIALDIPSGLDANDGAVLGAAFVALATFTFAVRKRGFDRGAGPECCGVVRTIDIGLPREFYGEAPDA